MSTEIDISTVNTEETTPIEKRKVSFRETIIIPRITYKIIYCFSEIGEIKVCALQLAWNVPLHGLSVTLPQNQNSVEHIVPLRGLTTTGTACKPALIRI